MSLEEQFLTLRHNGIVIPKVNFRQHMDEVHADICRLSLVEPLARLTLAAQSNFNPQLVNKISADDRKDLGKKYSLLGPFPKVAEGPMANTALLASMFIVELEGTEIHATSIREPFLDYPVLDEYFGVTNPPSNNVKN